MTATKRLVVYALRGAGQKRLFHLTDDDGRTLCGKDIPQGAHVRVRWHGSDDLSLFDKGPRCPRCARKAGATDLPLRAQIHDSLGRRTTVNVERLSDHKDAWGFATHGCEYSRPLGRGTWILCGKQAKHIGVDGDGTGHRLCAMHAGAAKRARSRYVNETQALLDLDGNQTHVFHPGKGRKGHWQEVTP